MEYKRMDLSNWNRREHYLHYMKEVVCSYSLTTELDITPLNGRKLYPALLWLLTSAVNESPAFRTSLVEDEPVVYNEMNPSYTVFNRQTETFIVLWTAYDRDYDVFLKAYESDVARYGHSTKLFPKSDCPPNTFDVSMLPWTTFTAFSLHAAGGGKHLLPIFTMGRIKEADGIRTLPLAVQVHHAVCDGYHVGRFICLLEEKLRIFGGAG